MAKKPTHEESVQRVKELEKELRESKERFRLIIESTNDLITTTTFSLTPKYTYVSPSNEILGYTSEDMIGKSGLDFIHPEDKKRLLPLLIKYVSAKAKNLFTDTDENVFERMTYRFRDKSGNWRDLQSTVNIIGDELLFISRDITEKRQTEDLIRAQRDLGLALSAAGELDDVLRLCVEAAINISGMDCGGVYLVDKDSGAMDLVFHKGFSAAFVNCVSHYDRDSDNTRLIMAGKPLYMRHEEMIPNAGEARLNEKLRAIAVIPIHNEGRVVGCLNISSHTLDKIPAFARFALEIISTQIGSVIARAMANAELNKEKERFRVLVEEFPLGVSLIRKDGHYEYVNPKFTELFGYTLEDIPTGKVWFDKAYPDRKYKHKAVLIWSQIKKDTKQGKFFQEEFDVKCKDGSKKTILFRMISMEAGQTLMLYEDATKTKRLEEQFQQAQKMEAIGTLAGGIAHDFNNLLMGIQGRASLMTIDIDSAHPYFEHLKGIEEYVKSATDLTKQLLGFARAGKYEVKPIDLNDIIKKSSMMFARTKKEITIHGKYQKDIWTVEVDQGQMEQALLNLYVNAWQAMPNGGEIYLETENVMIDKDYGKAYYVEHGRYVKISITDTGIGIDEATQQKIFDPFFTTKEMGRGTGLGLASVYGIIKNHGGFINVYSEKGEGSIFNIYLLATESEVRSQKSELVRRQSGGVTENIKSGHETVLFVDDENMLIDVAKQMLEMMGYKVFTAKSGREAIAIYKQNMDKIDMVILDMIMPDIGGSEVYDRLKEINPEVKVLLSSGYSITGQATDILNRGCNGFIQKPFKIKQLSHKLREILDRI